MQKPTRQGPNVPNADYLTYKEIIDDLLLPIDGRGLDMDTLKKLYESKLVYLENLRVKCFRALNAVAESEAALGAQDFTQDDYRLIVEASHETKAYLRHLVLHAMSRGLAQRKVV